MAFNLGMTWAQLLANIAQNSSDITDLWGEVDKLKIVTENDDYSTVTAYVQATPIPVVVFTDGNGGLFPYAGTYNDSHYFGRVKQVSDDEADVVYEIAYIEQDSTWRVGDATPLAPLYSPNFGGNPTAPTRSANDNSTKLATTAYADRSAEAAGYSAFITRSASGDVIEIEEAADGIPVKTFEGSINPVQNLNGYEYPWAGGTGKNKMNPFSDFTVSGVTVTVNDGVMTINGTASAAFSRAVSVHLKAGSYILSGAYGNADFYKGTLTSSNRMFISVGGNNIFDNSGGAFTVSTEGDYSVTVVFVSGYTFTNSVIKPMIRLATETDATFVPYSNICPITGWNEANISRGETALDSDIEQGGINSSGINVAATERIRTASYYPVSDSQEYTFRVDSTQGVALELAVSYYTTNDYTTQRTSGTGWETPPYTFTPPSGTKYIRVLIRKASNASITPSQVANVYLGANLTIPFGTTVYKGTLSYIGGGQWSIQRTHERVLLSSLSWSKTADGIFSSAIQTRARGTGVFPFMSDTYKQYTGGHSTGSNIASLVAANGSGIYVNAGSAAFYVADERYTNANTFKSDMGNVEFVYELATLPSPIIVSSEALTTLLGDNVIWLDCGNISDLIYRIDPQTTITELQQAVLDAYITDTASGDVVSITDGANGIPVKAFDGSILPQQNLNGQSAPYPAGGGKNKFDIDNFFGVDGYGSNWYRFSRPSKGSISKSGNTIVMTRTGVDDGFGIHLGALASGTWTVSFTQSNFCRFKIMKHPTYGVFSETYVTGYNMGQATGNVTDWVNSGTSVTFDSDGTGYYWVMFYTSSSSWTSDTISNFQLESGSTATSYAPYSNICPISGWTGANITRCGKNLYDKSTTEVGYYIRTDGSIGESSTWALSDYIPIGGESVTISGNNGWGSAPSVCFFDINKVYISGTHPTADPVTLTVPSGAAYMRTSMMGSLRNALQVEIGATATAYEDYTADTIVLSFGSTVYAGTITALGGGLWSVQPTHAIVDLGSLTYTYNSTYSYFAANPTGISTTVANVTPEMYCSIYGIGATRSVQSWGNAPDMTIGQRTSYANIIVKDSRYTDPDQYKTAVTGQTLVYELATLPDPIIVSASDLATLLGSNTVWMDVGSITGMTYRADTALYIAKLLGNSTRTLASASLNRTAILADEGGEGND